MISDNNPTRLWVTPWTDGDIRLGRGRTQKSLTVDVHSTIVRDRSRATSRILKYTVIIE